MVTPGFEVNFSVDGSIHQMAALAAYEVVFFSLLLQPEFEDKGVFAR